MWCATAESVEHGVPCISSTFLDPSAETLTEAYISKRVLHFLAELALWSLYKLVDHIQGR